MLTSTEPSSGGGDATITLRVNLNQESSSVEVIATYTVFTPEGAKKFIEPIIEINKPSGHCLNYGL